MKTSKYSHYYKIHDSIELGKDKEGNIHVSIDEKIIASHFFILENTDDAEKYMAENELEFRSISNIVESTLAEFNNYREYANDVANNLIDEDTSGSRKMYKEHKYYEFHISSGTTIGTLKSKRIYSSPNLIKYAMQLGKISSNHATNVRVRQVSKIRFDMLRTNKYGKVMK